jgi:hypothetical protein
MCMNLLSVDLTTGTIWGSMHQRVGVNGFGSWRMSNVVDVLHHEFING